MPMVGWQITQWRRKCRGWSGPGQGLVMTWLLPPLLATATNVPLPWMTPRQLEVAAEVWVVWVVVSHHPGNVSPMTPTDPSGAGWDSGVEVGDDPCEKDELPPRALLGLRHLRPFLETFREVAGVAPRNPRERLHGALYPGTTCLWGSFGGSRSLAVVAGVTLGEHSSSDQLRRAGAGVVEAAPM